MSELKLILLCGLPGCGKSTIANLLAKREGYPVFSVDPIESGILRSGIERSDITERAAYLVAENLAQSQLALGNSLIVDAVSASAEQKRVWIELAQKYNATLKVIECICNDEALQIHRINTRNRNIFGIPEISLLGIKTYKADYAAWQSDHIQLDASEELEANYSRTTQYLFTS